MPVESDLPLLGFVGWSGAGKTTLLTAVIPLLQTRGLRCALIKHAHHGFDIDRPGKDSDRLRRAGAGQVLIASRRRWALLVEEEHPDDPPLEGLIRHIDSERADLILVEGFKHAAIPKIEVYRAALGKPPLHPQDRDIIAVASDVLVKPSRPQITQLDLNAPSQIADFIIGLIATSHPRGPHARRPV